jgi:tetratricopeptide (TPR) repeat protein
MRRAHALPVAALALAAAALFLGDGSSPDRLFWIGSAAVVVAAVAGGAALIGRLPAPEPPPAGIAFFALLGAFFVWQAFSIAWSLSPSRSWDAANRTLVYLAFAALGALLAGVPRARVAAAFAALLGALFVLALAAKVVPALHGDYGRLARLRWPLGYWNELALLADFAVPLGLWAAARRRAAATLLVYAALVVAVLTFSRIGVVLALLAAVLWITVGSERLAALLAFAIALAVAAPIAVVGLLLPGIADDGQPHHVRLRDGLVFGAVLLVGAAVVAVSARFVLALELDPTRGAQLARAAAAVTAALALAALAAAVARAGGPADFVRARWHEFSNPVSAQVANTPGRFGTASSSNRWRWWQEAWAAFVDHPAQGTGAATFVLTDRTRRDSALLTVEPHNTPLQFLSELGIVGFLLYLGMIAGAVVAVRRRVGDAATAALLVVLLLGISHAAVDIDWDYVAVQAPLFALAGYLVAEPGKLRRRATLPAVATAVAALAALYSLVSPWLADRRLDAGYDAIARGDVAAAHSAASAAHALNPLALDPLYLLAATEDEQQARARFRRATELEPQNPDTWFDLGQFEFFLGRYRAAYEALNRSYTLDNFGPAGIGGGLLDQARCKIDPATCR